MQCRAFPRNSFASMTGNRMTDDKDAADPWKDILILTLDGGGTRGYASLLMLQKLMKEIGRIETGSAGASCENGYPSEAHPSSFGPINDDLQLVSKSADLKSIPNPKPIRGSRLSSKLGFGGKLSGKRTHPAGGMRVNAERRENTRKELISKDSKYLPCHYFDYIGGTSTGGLAALMLGRLRMSADECIDKYPEMAKEIFGAKKPFSARGALRDKYDATNLQNVIEDIVLERLPEQQTPRFLQLAGPEDLCKTVVIARKDDNNEGPHLFRSYDNSDENLVYPHNPGQADTCLIWEAGRATSAAPNYFEPITIGGHTYYDGGVGYNDPTEEVYTDVLIHTDCGYGDPMSISLVLSLGTGTELSWKQKAKGVLSRLRPLKRLHENAARVIGSVTNTVEVPRRMRKNAEDRDFKYFKWDGGGEVGALKLDNCKQEAFEKMGNDIEKHMEDKDDEIREVAEILVRKRRARFEDTDRWQRFAYCTLFFCPLSDICKLPCRTREELRHHLQTEHDGCSDADSMAAEVRPEMPDLRGPFGHRVGVHT